MDGEEYRSVALTLGDDGGLQLSAHDMGPNVERFWGDDDYEFWVEIKPHAMRQLAFALLRDRYAGREHSVDELREFCEQNAIEHQSVSLKLEDGGVQLPAHDMGPTVERMWGDDDYEPGVEIKPHAMRQLAFALLRDRYTGRIHAVDELREFCKQNAIKHVFGSWV